MHCLGAVSSGSASTQRAGSCGSVLGVVRALGVLVSEGRVQGPPRGYKEGPHCAAPLQQPPNNHVCEKDNYLCDRYVILVREIADRVTACSYLCVEVLLCTDCPCGLAKATCKDPVLPIPPSISIAPWQQSSEMLLEYWHISVVPSKGPEMMNNQSLYQAVRSRLHFSQVAAWWSRSKGSAPSYITTRVVSFSEENLRKFRETPSEHTFPLAACGDGNSIKVTVWALPRVEDVPVLSCPIHPVSDNEDEGAARALTPTKNAPIQGTSSNPEALLLPTLVDDRLQTPCNESGKHHCRCEEEDTGCPPSPSVQRVNGERKRRRSLPRGPDFAPSVVPHGTTLPPGVLTSVSELVVEERQRGGEGESRVQINGVLSVPNISEPQNGENVVGYVVNQPRNSGFVNYIDESLLNQLKLEDEGDKKNVEKRYKISRNGSGSSGNEGCEFSRGDNNCWDVDGGDKGVVNKYRNDKSGNFNKKECLRRWERADEFNNGFNNRSEGIGKINWITSTINERRETCGEKNFPIFVDPVPVFGNNFKPFNGRPNVVANPFAESSPFHESNPGPSTNVASNGGEKSSAQGEDLSKLMTRMRLPEKGSVEEGEDEEGGILDWISKVPGRVFGAKNISEPLNGNDNRNEARSKLNSSLELSQREFDEVLAVLRARTPGGRRRPTMQRILKRRERLDKQNGGEENSEKRDNAVEKKSETKYRKGRQDEQRGADKDVEGVYNVTNKADLLLGAILRSSGKERKGISEISNGARPRGPTTSLKGDKESGRTVQPVKNFGYETAQFLNTCPNSTGLNKRISRFKQLFAKEQNNGEGGNLQRFIVDESRAKRRIDFSGILSDGQPDGEASSSSSFNPTSNPSPSDIRRPFGNGKRSTKNLRLRIDERTANGFVHPQKEEVDTFGQTKNSTVIDNLENSDASDKAVPSAIEQERFRRSLGNAASMVFHSRTGLPLTSSPAPLRRGSCCFDYDSSLNSVSSKRSALFELNTPPSPGAVSLEEGDREAEITCEEEETTKRRNPSRGLPHSHALLGSFEESALNGRLEPVSTVHGFTAELGASGSFCPKHRKLPVTVFFYTLGDNDKVSTPYLAHINLGKKGYQVPRSGTIQVTLLNPLGTVVKMFVVMYDLSDMPARSHTFLRQRTLRDKTLRYLIHLRFMSGKSGRIYLHTDIRMIICRKSDVDTASDLGAEPPKELRSFVHGPTNPKFSPRC